jgi:hypothetical protein
MGIAMEIKANDAVVIFGKVVDTFQELVRVVGKTEDGLLIGMSERGSVIFESEVGKWKKCGRFVRGWFRWKFIPLTVEDYEQQCGGDGNG